MLITRKGFSWGMEPPERRIQNAYITRHSPVSAPPSSVLGHPTVPCFVMLPFSRPILGRALPGSQDHSLRLLASAVCSLLSQPPDPHTLGGQKTKEAGVDQKTRKMSSCFCHSPLPPVGPAGFLGSVPSQGHLVGFHSSRGPQASAWCSGHQKPPNLGGSPCPPG